MRLVELGREIYTLAVRARAAGRDSRIGEAWSGDTQGSPAGLRGGVDLRCGVWCSWDASTTCPLFPCSDRCHPRGTLRNARGGRVEWRHAFEKERPDPRRVAGSTLHKCGAVRRRRFGRPLDRPHHVYLSAYALQCSVLRLCERSCEL